MDTRIIDEELANYGSFINNQISESESDAELDALQPPEEPFSEEQLLQFGDFVPAAPATAPADEENSADSTSSAAGESSAASQEASQVVSSDVSYAGSPSLRPASAGLQTDSERRKEEARKKEAKPVKVRHPIGVKLILIISLLVLFSMGVITVLVSYFISKDTRINA